MIRCCALFLLLCIGCSSLGQTATFSPLGVLIKPADKVEAPAEILAAIPKKVTVRLVKLTRLSSDGESVVIYDRGDQNYEPHTHIAVIRNGKRVADFSIIKLFEKQGVGDTYEFFLAAQFTTPDKQNAFIAAFRNIGDGSGTLFVLLINRQGQYIVSWHKAASQAQLRVRKDGGYQLWDSDEGDDCVWCAHHYEVSDYIWKNDTLFRRLHHDTKDALDPSQFSETPIEIEDESSKSAP